MTKEDKIIEELRKKYSIWDTSAIRGSSETKDNDEWMSLPHVVMEVEKQKQQHKDDIDKLNKITKYAMETVTCTAGVYCQNTEHIRKLLQKYQNKN